MTGLEVGHMCLCVNISTEQMFPSRTGETYQPRKVKQLLKIFDLYKNPCVKSPMDKLDEVVMMVAHKLT